MSIYVSNTHLWYSVFLIILLSTVIESIDPENGSYKSAKNGYCEEGEQNFNNNYFFMKWTSICNNLNQSTKFVLLHKINHGLRIVTLYMKHPVHCLTLFLIVQFLFYYIRSILSISSLNGGNSVLCLAYFYDTLAQGIRWTN